MVLVFVIVGWLHRAVKLQLPIWSLAVSLVATATAQLSSEPTHSSSALNPKYSVSGTVVDSVTGEPIRRALVQVGALAMLTDSSGTFQFDGLPAGEFSVSARKPGFFTEQDITPAPLPPPMITVGPNPTPVLLKLMPGGVVYGRVTDADGEAIEGSPVRLYQLRLLDGRKRWQQSHMGHTDEQGGFRMGNLQPGTYYLAVGPGQYDVISARQSTLARGYSQVFYPTGNDLASASPLIVAPGQKLQADLLLKLENLYEVSGVVTGFDPHAGINVFFTSESGEQLPVLTRIDLATGQFRTRIPPGTYKLRAIAQDLSASMRLSVHSDIAGIQVALHRGRFIPVITQAPSSNTRDLRNPTKGLEIPAANVRLISEESSLQPSEYFIRFMGDQTHRVFGLDGVEPGTYTVEVSPNVPGYVQSVRCGDVDLLQEDLHVSSELPEPIEVLVRNDPATLTGLVTGMETNRNAGIIVLPDLRSFRRPQVVYAGPDGHFQLTMLAPGEYSVLAFDRLESLEYRNPETLSSYMSRAAHVTLSPSAEGKVSVNLIRVEK